MRGFLRAGVIFLILFCLSPKGLRAQNVVAFFTANIQSGCAPLIVSFTDNSTGVPTSWFWDFGNGQTSNLPNPSVVYNSSGLYNVTLIASNASSSDTITRFQFVEISQPPTSLFQVTQSSGCIPLTTQFQNFSFPGSSPIANTIWNFDDGGISSQYNPQRTYTTPGTYFPSLLVVDSFGCQTNYQLPNPIIIGAQPNASFTANNQQFCDPPANVNFNNTSSGLAPVNYLWRFGDGSTSNSVNPSHTYNSAGNFPVTLVLTDSLGCVDSIRQNNFIRVIALSASFTQDTTTVCVGSPVQFTNSSSPAGTDWSWDFGDGNNSTLQNPRHSYSSPGSYTVNLQTDLNPLGCSDQIAQSNLINVLPVPVASFTASNNSACRPPLTASFSQNGSGGVSYFWDFGDGNTGAGPNVNHTYTNPGAYQVRLVTVNAQGCTDTSIIDSAVQILPPSPNFSANPRSGCAPLNVQFNDVSSFVDPLVRWEWDFGDGNSSTIQNPIHTYQNSGSYSVQLTIENNQGCTDSTLKLDFIVAGDTPVANFTLSSLNPCVDELVQFTDLSTPVDAWLWSFGDGFQDTAQNPSYRYADTGSYDIELVVEDRGCPDDTLIQNLITVQPPKANFSFAINCNSPFTIAFTDSSEGAINYFWDFGDGNQATSPNPIHSYLDTGAYTVQLVVENPGFGCTDTTTRQVYIANVQAAFIVDTVFGCRPLRVNFTNNSLQGLGFEWIFGDGQADTAINPSHVYADTGTFSVSLIVTDLNGCKDTFNRSNLISAIGPTAGFATLDLGGCVPFQAAFWDSSTANGSPIVSWSWDFDDGNFSLNQNDSALYVVPGRKTIQLAVQDQNGCVDTLIKPNYVFPTDPIANFRSDTLSCPGQSIQFTNTSNGAGLSYKWYFGDGDSSTLRNPTHSYAVDGSYNVTLAITDLNGCKDTLNIIQQIDIESPVANFVNSGTAASCPPFLVTFTNTSSGYPNRYEWDFGDGGNSNQRNPFHVYQTPGVYDVRLIITSRFGCKDTIIKQSLIRIDGPIGSFDFDTNFGCEGAQVNFQANISNTKVIIWDFDDGFTLVGQTNRSHVYNTAGTFYPRITIQDSVGCTRAIVSDDSILIDIVPDIQLPNDTVVCQGNNVYLDSKVQQAFSFQWIPTNFLSCPTCPATLSTSRQDITYAFTANSQYGCTNTDSVTILIDTIFLPNVLGDLVLCPGEQVTLNQNGEVLPLNQWNPKNFWEPALYMDDSAIATPTIAPLDTITYRLTAYPKNNCRTGSGNFASVSRLIATFLPIDKVEVRTINDTFVCPGDSVLLASELLAASEFGYDVLWQPSFAVDRPQVLSPFAIPPATTNYRLILSSTSCEPDTARVRVELKSRPFVDAGSDQTVIAGSSIPMYADAGNDVRFQWSPEGEFDCDTCYNSQLTPVSSGMYYVQVTDQFGCRNIDSVFVFVKSECGKEGLFLPTAFSPNGDGNNDVYRIRSLGIQEIEFFRIFNRWGELVFETKDINQGWDGRNGNGYYPAGVYTFFVRALCPDGSLSDFSGNLTIIR